MIVNGSSNAYFSNTSSQAMSLGLHAEKLFVKWPVADDAVESVPLANGMQEFYRTGEFTDVALLCAGQTFLAHRIVLAAQSAVFRQGLCRSTGKAQQADTGREEIRLADVANPEAVRWMLDYMYQIESPAWKIYTPRTQEINIDVLRLAQTFQLSGLTEQVMHWLAKDLTTENVLERLKICEDFRLQELTDKILEQLTMNRVALGEVANSPQITQHPKLLQALLQMTAAMPAEDEAGSAAQPTEPTVEEYSNEAKLYCPSDSKFDKANENDDKESAMKFEIPPDLPSKRIITLTGKVAPTPYIANRAKQLAGLTVEQVLTNQTFVDAHDRKRKYRVADLRYDLRQGFLSLAVPHKKRIA